MLFQPQTGCGICKYRNRKDGSMLRRTSWAGALLMVSVVPVSTSAYGQNYPNKPVRLITNAAGGGNDFIARLVAPGLSDRLGQPVLIDNRPGGSLPGQVVLKSPPDGHTLLVSGGTFWTGPLLQSDIPYDVVADFAPVTLLGSSPNILVVHPSLPVKSVRDLIALAKARPGQLNYSAPSIGSAQNLAAELLKAMAKVDIVRVSYRGNSQALMAVGTGETQLTFAVASAAATIKATKLRALAITGAKRSPLFPELPTIAEAGLPGYEANAMQGVFAPAQTPAAIIKRLHTEIAAVLASAEVRERLTASGIEAGGQSPAEFASMVKAEISRMGKVIRDANIRTD
jgi:tripartite-type tricarboxylate transporter receptor subunit TctC